MSDDEHHEHQKHGTLSRLRTKIIYKGQRPNLSGTDLDRSISNSTKTERSNTTPDIKYTPHGVSRPNPISSPTPVPPPVLKINVIDITTRTDDEVIELLKSAIDNLVEGKQAKKNMFEQIPESHRRNFLRLHYERMNDEMSGEKSPEYQIQCLNNVTIDNIYSQNCKKILEHIALALKKYSLTWRKAFGENSNGLNAMLKAMRACITKIQSTREKISRAGTERREKPTVLIDILNAGLEAFRSYLSLGRYFNSLKESLAIDIAEITIDILNILYSEHNEHVNKTKLTCAILLSTLAMSSANDPSNDQNIVQLLSQSAKKWCPDRERFDCLVHELDGSIEMASNFLMCINGIFFTLSTEQRYHLRSELFRSGFKIRFEELQRRVDCEDSDQKNDLLVQINLFLRHVDDDYQSMNIKLEDISNTWTDIQASFNYLYSSVKNTPSESVLASIINRLMCIQDDETIRHSYFRLIDESITRIVFSKSACDPDFETYSPDSESIDDFDFGSIDDASSIPDDSLSDLPQTDTNENIMNPETEKNLKEECVHTVEESTSTPRTSNNSPSPKENIPLPSMLPLEKIQTTPILQLEKVSTTSILPIENIVSPMPPLENISLPPLLPVNVPPPPPSKSDAGGPPPPSPLFPGVPNIEGLPPPPPLFPGIPGIGGPPPPPPPGITGNGLPPPPPFTNMNALIIGPPLPKYLIRKNKYDVGVAVKKMHWGKINPQAITKDSIWANIDEKDFQNNAFFTTITENFATKSAPAIAPVESDSKLSATTAMKKPKEFRVLDARVGQNFAIMFRQLKSNPQQFRQWLLACDSKHLTSNLLAQLDKSLPTPDELKKLSELKNDMNDLPDVEHYFCTVSDIKHLQQRIKILLFKSQYKELLEYTEKSFVAAHKACETVRHSERFPKLIGLVLTIGNYMNSSVKTYEPIYGFDISFLPKLHSTKANDNKRTLLHFILQQIEKDHVDLLKFGDEFRDVAGVASKIQIDELQGKLNEIKSHVNNAQTDLDSIKNSSTDSTSEDYLAETIEGFVKSARDDVERLETLNVKMTNAYQDLCDYLALDSTKTPFNELFANLTSFCTVFLTCLQENRLRRKQDERKLRAQISKQRIEAKLEQKPFFKPSDEDTDVVSNLISVLKDASVTSQLHNNIQSTDHPPFSPRPAQNPRTTTTE